MIEVFKIICIAKYQYLYYHLLQLQVSQEEILLSYLISVFIMILENIIFT